MIETILVDVAERQGLIAILLVFFIIRSQTIYDRCLTRQNEVTTTLLLMVGDILCDKNDSEKCQMFDSYKTKMEENLRRGNSVRGHKRIFSILQVHSSGKKKI